VCVYISVRMHHTLMHNDQLDTCYTLHENTSQLLSCMRKFQCTFQGYEQGNYGKIKKKLKEGDKDIVTCKCERTVLI
jgi:hypothetical protein